MFNKELHTIKEEDNILKLNNKALLVTQVVFAAHHPHCSVFEITYFKYGKKNYYQINYVNTVPVSHKKKAINIIEENDNDSF